MERAHQSALDQTSLSCEGCENMAGLGLRLHASGLEAPPSCTLLPDVRAELPPQESIEDALPLFTGAFSDAPKTTPSRLPLIMLLVLNWWESKALW